MNTNIEKNIIEQVIEGTEQVKAAEKVKGMAAEKLAKPLTELLSQVCAAGVTFETPAGETITGFEVNYDKDDGTIVFDWSIDDGW